MLESYYYRDEQSVDRDEVTETTPVMAVTTEAEVVDCNETKESSVLHDFRLDNSKTFQNIKSELYGLNDIQTQQLIQTLC